MNLVKNPRTAKKLSIRTLEDFIKQIYKWSDEPFNGFKIIHPKSPQKKLNCVVIALMAILLFEQFGDITILKRWKFDEKSQDEARLWMRKSYLALCYGEEPPKIKIKYI